MVRLYLILVFIYLFSSFLQAQKMSGNDSAVLRTYWNKISIKAIGSLGDFLYNGIDNYLTVNCPDSISKNLTIFLGVNNGTISKTEDNYLTIPKYAGRSFVTTYLINENNDTLVVGKKQFIVLTIPFPVLSVGKTVIRDKSRINRKVFFRSDSLKLFFTDDFPESDSWFKIRHFMIGYTYGGIYISSENEGPILSLQTLDFIKKLAPGQEVVIKVNSITTSQVITYLPLVRFKIL